ncbi:MAG: methyltransferase domain-containing protein [Dehalococcoidales bacterium]|nr:MAG: methyltransferase domain-containing protein [Dehalococcoidales bacterium]
MDYKEIINDIKSSLHLISMTPIEKIVDIGYTAGMNSNSGVLDLCCGYGEMLKIWNEAFGIKGTGVDISREFIDEGERRLEGAEIKDISLICADVLGWETDNKYDFACLSGEDFGGIEDTIHRLEKYVKSDGKLIIGTRYSKVDNPPAELIEFEGETLPLKHIYDIFYANGYFITSMATDTQNEWERYIMWSARRNLAACKGNSDDPSYYEWCKKWFETYFGFRREYEGYGTFVIEKY